ncbi:MAG: hypothetical protein H8K03_02105 [Nitrospira sp.]|jgi:hypothetical protein|nr:hypothetical protein [Nitrospira sp. BO4]
MTIPRLPMCGLLLGAIALWTPSANGFSPEDYNVAARPAPVPNIPAIPGMSSVCDELGDDLWNKWLQGKVPKNQATIDKLMEAKRDCPKLAGSMDRMANEIKAQKDKIGSADANVSGVGNELGR